MLEEKIQEYVKKNPEDNYAILKAMFSTYKAGYVAFFVGRIVNKIVSMLTQYALVLFLNALERDEPLTIEQMYFPLSIEDNMVIRVVCIIDGFY